jgi:hypothetical protein
MRPIRLTSTRESNHDLDMGISLGCRNKRLGKIHIDGYGLFAKDVLRRRDRVGQIKYRSKGSTLYVRYLIERLEPPGQRESMSRSQ